MLYVLASDDLFQNKMKRKYKEDTPQNTILKIKQILAKIGVITYESYWGQPHENVYSCRTQLIESQGDFGTNGKGMSVEYVLASSHAEFMERLQNGFLFGMYHLIIPFIKKIFKEEGFIFYPDEHYLTKEEFMKLPHDFFEDLFGNIFDENGIDSYYSEVRQNGFDGIVSVPFFDCRNKKVVYFPYNMLLQRTGSNGMSAGNTTSEGVFQALCEILERAAAATIYKQCLTPPSIPHSFIEKNKVLFNIINDIEKEGYDVILKDFSANCRFPVVGTLIIDRKKNKYRLNVGADTCFDVALSRTLTEIHQGISNSKELERLMLPIPKTNNVAKVNGSSFIDANLQAFFENGTGLFPASLFGKNASYAFDYSVFCDNENYSDGCRYLINLIESIGANVYLRDTSYLGFPSFYVYVSHLSVYRNPVFEDTPAGRYSIASNIEYSLIEKHLYDFKSIFNRYDAMEFFVNKFSPDALRKDDFAFKSLLKIKIIPSHYWNSIPASYFLTLFAYFTKNYEKAIEYLDVYLCTVKLQKSSYYKEVKRFLKYLSKGMTDDYINKNIDKSIIRNFTVEKILENLDLPTCPDCDCCPINNVCTTNSMLKIHNSMQKEMRQNKIDQMYFSKFTK